MPATTASPPLDLSESRGTEVNIVAWVMTGLAVVVVGLKLFTRSRITRVLDWSDFFIFLSLALSIVASSFITYSVHLGFGRHTAAVLAEPNGPRKVVRTAMWQQLGYPFNIGAFSLPNISIAILINRLLVPNTTRELALYSLVILQVIFAVVSIFIIFLQCHPTAKLWNSALTGTCLDPSIFNGYSYWLSAYTTLTDFVLAIVPIMAFWRLQMKTSTKLGVCLMMALTLLSAIATLVKATYLHLFLDKTDPLFTVVPLVIWGLIEQNVVIIAACVPTLRPFFTAFSGGKATPSTDSSSMLTTLRSTLDHRSPRIKRSDSMMQLDGMGVDHDDTESRTSQQVIWRTVEFKVDSQDGA
ncbi:hypothetical protein F5Y18DRAFT_296648 [Xylariaceae sp. FL1019]|nr:hypothetical protein F5Y18DRAFT_296648 [Xylariaceae sp. FL1019]